MPDTAFSPQMLEAALHTAVGAIVILDDKGVIRKVNPATEKIFGFSQASCWAKTSAS